MSVRDLMVTIDFQANTGALDSINSQTDDLVTDLSDVGTTGESALTDVGSAAQSTEDDMNDLNNSSKGLLDTLGDNWEKITLGAGVAGMAIENMGQKQAGLTEQTERLSIATGETADTFRDAALEITNVTFPLEDALDLMETGRKQGLDSVEALKEYASTWDMIGDATGESGPALAEASQGLRAVGISAGEEEEALAAFGYITQETTSDVSEFLRFLERTGPELNEMGMDVNDAAAMLGVLEHELGMSGRTARQEFRSAVNEADGDLEKLYDTLGVTDDMVQEYTDTVAESSNVIGDLADNHADSYTMMDRIQQKVSELTYAYGPLIEGMTALVPFLLALGPAFKAAAFAKDLFSKSLLMSPITWIIGAIIALAAAVVLLWKNFDGVSQFLVDSWNQIIDGIITALPTIIDTALLLVETILQSIVQYLPMLVEAGVELLSSLIEGLTEALPMLLDAVIQIIQIFIEMIVENAPLLIEAAIGIIMTLVDGIIELLPMLVVVALELIITLSTSIIELLPMIIEVATQIVLSLITGLIQMIPEIIVAAIELIFALIDGIISMLPEIIATAIELVFALIDGIISMLPEIIAAAVEMVIALITGLIQMLPEIVSAAIELGEAAIDAILNLDWLGLGIDIIQGFIDGMLGMVGSVVSAAKDIASSVWDTVTGFFDTSSPSRLMMSLGEDVGGGFQIGLDDSAMKVAESASRLAEAAYPDVHYIDDYRTPQTYTPERDVEHREHYYEYQNENVVFSPNITINANGQGESSARSIKKEVEKIFPNLMSDFIRVVKEKR